jgi:hypothetical protein
MKDPKMDDLLIQVVEHVYNDGTLHEVVQGNARVEAMRQTGLKEIPVKIVETKVHNTNKPK